MKCGETVHGVWMDARRYYDALTVSEYTAMLFWQNYAETDISTEEASPEPRSWVPSKIENAIRTECPASTQAEGPATHHSILLAVTGLNVATREPTSPIEGFPEVVQPRKDRERTDAYFPLRRDAGNAGKEDRNRGRNKSFETRSCTQSAPEAPTGGDSTAAQEPPERIRSDHRGAAYGSASNVRGDRLGVYGGNATRGEATHQRTVRSKPGKGANMTRRIVIATLHLYQRTLSPDHGWFRSRHPYGYCRFWPTCSQYAIETVERHGVVSGSMKAFWRLLRCNPFSRGGIDPVQET